MLSDLKEQPPLSFDSRVLLEARKQVKDQEKAKFAYEVAVKFQTRFYSFEQYLKHPGGNWGWRQCEAYYSQRYGIKEAPGSQPRASEERYSRCRGTSSVYQFLDANASLEVLLIFEKA